ncbi:hypothetical protein T281_04730 [Rhodomicrobium udaipurense JA643]|uniref:Multidrug efflux pump Tap n=1 Tax=Rhodomicrobium udaipurense TaxID=1202716 RepID=A0A8I1KFW6_9HYPH|nr:MFS transporter [Rhodomicrobium udaipurense]KAI95566.1 hypothetical protein T281_04730 [Rhodomicrobium udaipurense JA643]MBJ7542125.1 MFS transporter [Rhodomicrobium udaipurense]
MALLRVRLSRLLVDIAPLRQSAPFRLLFIARTASLLVYGVLAVAVSLQVFALTQSSFHVGAVAFAAAGGTALGLLVGAPMADRYDRKPQMVWSRSAFLITMLILLGNACLEHPHLWVIYLAVSLGGIAGGFSSPALMAAAPSLLPREHLAAAGALTAIGLQTGAIIGPPIAALFIAGPGFAFCYAFVVVGAAITPVLLSCLPSLPPERGHEGDRSSPGLAGAVAYLKSNPLVVALLATELATTLFVAPQVLIPKIAIDTFAAGAAGASLLYTAPAIGGLIAALTSGWTRHVAQPGRMLFWATICWGLCAACVSSGQTIESTSFLFGLLGFFSSIAQILRVALLQCSVPDPFRGRVFALWLFQSNAGPAFGGLQTGMVAGASSVNLALVAGGAACIAATVAISAAFPALRNASLTRRQEPVEVS